MSLVFLRAEWRQLVMLNYEIDPHFLEGRVPRGTEIDFHDGRTFVSLVGFRFLSTKVLGLPVPFHRNFAEVNLRFYVRRKVEGGIRRGVVFVREIVPRFLVAEVARLAFHENYVCRRMSHDIRRDTPSSQAVTYRWREGTEDCTLLAESQTSPSLPLKGTLEAFISEHYFGYTALPNGGCFEYAVEHEPWTVSPASRAEFKGETAYPQELREVLRREPASAFLAEGSTVSVSWAQRIV